MNDRAIIQHTVWYDAQEDHMASKVKVTVSVDQDLIRELGKVSRQTGQPRSRLVEEALHLWRRRQLERALKEGYEAMAREDRATAESRLAAGWESLR
jgi:metal-responsive CopG/Arc/MetJ family transcriptional regulator